MCVCEAGIKKWKSGIFIDHSCPATWQKLFPRYIKYTILFSFSSHKIVYFRLALDMRKLNLIKGNPHPQIPELLVGRART